MLFRGSDQLEVVAVLARCGEDTNQATNALSRYIQGKRHKGRSDDSIVLKIEDLERRYKFDMSLHEAFHTARSQTGLPRSNILPSIRRQPRRDSDGRQSVHGSPVPETVPLPGAGDPPASQRLQPGQDRGLSVPLPPRNTLPPRASISPAGPNTLGSPQQRPVQGHYIDQQVSTFVQQDLPPIQPPLPYTDHPPRAPNFDFQARSLPSPPRPSLVKGRPPHLGHQQRLSSLPVQPGVPSSPSQIPVQTRSTLPSRGPTIPGQPYHHPSEDTPRPFGRPDTVALDNPRSGGFSSYTQTPPLTYGSSGSSSRQTTPNFPPQPSYPYPPQRTPPMQAVGSQESPKWHKYSALKPVDGSGSSSSSESRGVGLDFQPGPSRNQLSTAYSTYAAEHTRPPRPNGGSDEGNGNFPNPYTPTTPYTAPLVSSGSGSSQNPYVRSTNNGSGSYQSDRSLDGFRLGPPALSPNSPSAIGMRPNSRAPSGMRGAGTPQIYPSPRVGSGSSMPSSCSPSTSGSGGSSGLRVKPLPTPPRQFTVPGSERSPGTPISPLTLGPPSSGSGSGSSHRSSFSPPVAHGRFATLQTPREVQEEEEEEERWRCSAARMSL